LSGWHANPLTLQRHNCVLFVHGASQYCSPAKAFYDILKALAVKYDFSYPEDELLALAAEVKLVVDDKVGTPTGASGTTSRPNSGWV
jgi:hypothetical protein